MLSLLNFNTQARLESNEINECSMCTRVLDAAVLRVVGAVRLRMH